MKNFVASVIALVVGFFAVTVAAVMGLFIGIAALVAKPFIKKKLATAYAEAVNRNQPGSDDHNATVIDGEYDDITAQSGDQGHTVNRQYSQLVQS